MFFDIVFTNFGQEKKAENIPPVENHRLYRMCHEEISKALKKGLVSRGNTQD